MKLKTVTVDGKTYAEVQDGKPVYVGDDGKETPFDAPHSVATISRLNGEAKGHREAKEAAEAKLKGFDGIEDAAAALKALETVKNLDAGQLVTAGKVEEIKAAAKKAAEDQVAAAAKAANEQINTLTSERDKLMADLFGEKVGGAFTRSKFVTEKAAVPADMLQAMFGSRFKVENGKVVGYAADGQPIYSRTKAGEIADFDEALESMVDGYANRDSILKGSGTGSGAKPNGGAGGGGKSISRKEFESLPPADRQARIREGVKLVD
ncbi:DUF6651 domain-containing protein [Xanthobacter tagetidis]|uniref:DUF6651 domain-containing protein n=1 Tax=Xanthobacter tagetidis TaxID=60216 RepID=A0A3L7AIU7_9HYPH|nr:DUF6651 domain-containing protein [Xanthobacter tagetidis]MBB6306229.1 hypothetical protein [Xanthobacter tagetidis]RLP79511.1 hypothetical protein D9R14_07550 [Xanthobacter tagetidis]